MNELERRTLLGAAGIGAIAALSKAGPLNPPAGSVTPTGRTLDDIYNRIPAPNSQLPGAFDNRVAILGGTSTVVINQSGSYILAGDLRIAGNAIGIHIQTHHVTLDLNGFQVGRTDTVANSIGIHVENSLGTTIRNGKVTGSDIGINCLNTTGDVLIEDVLVRACGTTGIQAAGRCTTVRRCIVNDSGGTPQIVVTGIHLSGECSVIDQCVVSRFTTLGTGPAYRGIGLVGGGGIVSRCTVSNTSPTPGMGIFLSGQIAYRDNTVVNFNTPYSAINGAGSGGGNA